MAKEESTEPERPARKQKRAVEPVEEPAPSPAPTPALPTSSQVRKAKKADLVAWAKQLDLDGEASPEDLERPPPERVRGGSRPLDPRPPRDQPEAPGGPNRRRRRSPETGSDPEGSRRARHPGAEPEGRVMALRFIRRVSADLLKCGENR